jgi:hypothetical protein
MKVWDHERGRSEPRKPVMRDDEDAIHDLAHRIDLTMSTSTLGVEGSKYMIRFIAFAGLIALTACNQTGARTPGGEMFMSDAEILAKDDTQCRSFGASPGSNAYLQCRMTLNQNRHTAADRQQEYAARNLRTGAMLLNGPF